MPDDLTNLLPPARQRAIKREYFIRLSVVVVFFVAALAGAAMILLVPTYRFLSESLRAKEAHLASVESALSSADESAFASRLAALAANSAALAALAKAPSASAAVRSALAVPRPGVVLSHLSYTPASGSRSGTLAISGTAATRDALRSYQIALSAAPFATAADLPVSAYAKDSNITFMITVTLAPSGTRPLTILSP